MKRSGIWAVAAMTTAVAAGSFASAAGAVASSSFRASDITPTTPLPTAISYLEGQISARQAELATLAGAVISAKAVLSSSVSSTLTSNITAASSGLATLSTAAQGDANLTQVRADLTTIMSFVVYSVLAPQVTFVVKAAKLSSVAATLVRLEPRVAFAIAAEPQRAHPVIEAKGLYHDIVATLTSVSANLAVVSQEMLSIPLVNTPGTQAIIVSANSNLAGDRQSIITCRSSLQHIVSLLATPGIASLARS